MSKFAEKLIKRAEALRTEHSRWQAVWRAVAKYVFPNAHPVGSISNINRGNPKYQPLNTIGIDCATLLSAFIYSNTVFSGEQWFDLIKEVSKGEDQPSRDETELLQRLALKTMETIINSNFDHTYRQFIAGYVSFGTAPFHWEFDDGNKLITRQWLITNNIFVSENSVGLIDTVFREFEYTARQAVQAFGYENLSEKIRKAFDDESEQEKRFKFLHCTYPRNKRDKQKTTPQNKAFAEIYIDVENKQIVLEGGRDDFPYCVPRFYNYNETYGRCPAINAIPALKAVSIADWAFLKTVEFQAKPMVFAPPSTYDKINIESDTVNAWNSADGDVKIWSPTGNPNVILEFVELKKEEIRKMFYVDRIQYLDDKKMTATEAQLRYDEMIQSFSPVLVALQNEFFTPFIEGVANEIIRRGLIDIPESLLNKGSLDFKVEYRSRLNTKLKGAFNANLITFTRLMAEYGQLRSASPLGAVYLNDDSIIKTMATNCNVLETALNDDKTIEQIKEAQVEQAQQQQMAEMVKIKPVDTQATPAPNSMQAQAMGNYE